MEGAIVLFAVGAVGQAVAHGHIGLVVHERGKQCGGGFCRVRVVAVHHEVVVRIDVAHHLAHDVSLALSALGAHDGSVLARDGGRVVGGIVVVHVNVGIRQDALEVVDHLSDGHGFVVAGNEHGYGCALGGRLGGGVLLHGLLLG